MNSFDNNQLQDKTYNDRVPSKVPTTENMSMAATLFPRRIPTDASNKTSKYNALKIFLRSHNRTKKNLLH